MFGPRCVVLDKPTKYLFPAKLSTIVKGEEENNELADSRNVFFLNNSSDCVELQLYHIKCRRFFHIRKFAVQR